MVIKPAVFRPPPKHSALDHPKFKAGMSNSQTYCFLYIYIHIYIRMYIYIYTYIGIGQKLSFTIFGGMNIYLPTILITRGRGF